MKTGLHPEYGEATITCACGEVIHTRSTQAATRIEICSKCHPFFTGKQKIVDTAGRVERFEKKYAEISEDLDRQREEDRQTRIEAAKERTQLQVAEREERKKRLAERQRRKEERAAVIGSAKEEAAQADAKSAEPPTAEGPAPDEAKEGEAQADAKSAEPPAAEGPAPDEAQEGKTEEPS
ncbi:MAG: 50S ribosomal protein L31 [Nitrospinae bacterium]|nr:50S ribosomal protein L31 [Nitrospinota bacterium]